MAYYSNTDSSLQGRTNQSRQKTNIKCLQLNLQHSWAATLNLTQIILHYIIDIAFVQESYTILNKVVGFPKSFRIFAHGSNRKRSAIIVNNNQVDVIAITQVSHEDIILTEFRYESLTFYGASLYLPINRDIERDLQTIEDILQLTKWEGIILAIDTNARVNCGSIRAQTPGEKRWGIYNN